ncbi:MAG TPA: lytic murein transglycosylase [Afifellaceae bacterium]|nr:lytic murein transglycosylase [Afifellaceae bacterium]
MRRLGYRLAGPLAALAGLLAAAGPAMAQACGGDFNAWLDGLKREAMAEGVSAATLQAAAPVLRFDQGVVRRDRGQAVFAQSFLEFAGRMVNSYRLEHGARNLQRHAATFERIERQFGVPGPVIAAFWGLETDYGANTGDFPTVTALASLAYDCRRPELFRPQLIAALKILQRGDLRPGDMRGAWAGELGQTQFLPLDYLENGVDYDGDGRVDLLRSVPDVLASSANVLAQMGWRRGEPWLQEVRAPADLPWAEADLAIRHPRSQWAAWGVRAADGGALPADQLAAALVLPMGRNGPAFLAYPNFDVYLEWNQSLVYATTAAYFATRLAGAPRVSGGGNAPALSLEQVKQLQELLASRGYDVGGVDGVIGAKTRAAIKDAQQRLGLPADSWPTPELLARLRG